MFELTYKSVAASGISNADILAIRETAISVNKTNDITGCLVFYKNQFIQILEGDEEIVQKVFSKIVEDSRHLNVQVLYEGEKDQRFFPDWNMAFTDISVSLGEDAEVKSYANNLLLLSEFIEKPTTTLKMFWRGINKLIINPTSL
ncbi:BLUF domain-containing protein [Cellulophaga sp. E16_2]|uniref:BLUF domain protein n=1 Tax=Cellulophaga algicola (strain DSM 14237 / IC166 / ACAM 630) TaxID=688270 RepID=E6X5L6_CELAD|nr:MULTISPECIES: BLUF domain-containing protein [Cellulophaga]ADV48382.1 BLUF domain protein [Cellulophaga algicola DSM 14237]MBO0590803.1 BLUF domain-containing protein [Cellulophaga sp. E16_2]